MGAQDGYYNSTVGKTLKWAIYGDDGNLFGYCHETLTRMDGDIRNADVRYAYGFYDKEYQSVIGSKPFEFAATIENGATRAYVNNIAKALKSGDYMPVGDWSSIPDDITVGSRIPDTEIKVRVLTVYTATNQYTRRKVTARESVSVPAGTFDCYLLEDDELLNGNGPFHVKSWVTKGIGMVRQVIYKEDGTVNQIFELTK